MSRTKKGAKHPCSEIWNRRPTRTTEYGPLAKKWTNKMERGRKRKDIDKNIKENQ